jgi:hypothetical protein
MKSLFKTSLILLTSIIWFGCEGDFRREAIGAMGQVVVIMDSTEFDSQTAEAIRQTFGRPVRTLPRVPSLFDLTFRDINTNAELEQIKKFKNLIIAAPIDDSTNTSQFIQALLGDQVEEKVKSGEVFAFPLQDEWYRNQWTLILTATSDSALAEKIMNSEETLTESLLEKEFIRWRADIYDRGEQLEVEDSLWTNFGWKIRVQHDWFINLDTSYVHNGEENHFLTMRRLLPTNDRWFWAWWKNDVENPEFLDNDWINAKRDSLMEKWMRGTRDSSYVTTEYRRPVESEQFTLDGDIAFETLGTWRMTNDAMGGPFVNFTVYDDETQRLFILEFGQFAPKYSKRDFVRQFRAMLRTFESDSSWAGTPEQTMAEN